QRNVARILEIRFADDAAAAVRGTERVRRFEALDPDDPEPGARQVMQRGTAHGAASNHGHVMSAHAGGSMPGSDGGSDLRSGGGVVSDSALGGASAGSTCGADATYVEFARSASSCVWRCSATYARCPEWRSISGCSSIAL